MLGTYNAGIPVKDSHLIYVLEKSSMRGLISLAPTRSKPPMHHHSTGHSSITASLRDLWIASAAARESCLMSGEGSQTLCIMHGPIISEKSISKFFPCITSML